MRAALGKSSPALGQGIVNKGQLAMACLLLVGVTVLGYGYFQQDKIGLCAGLVVIIGGVLWGIAQILSHGNRQHAR